MFIRLKPNLLNTSNIIRVPSSKSETNRLLLLRALYPDLIIENQSDSDDSVAVINALDGRDLVDVGHAGTAMRFLTAYFSMQAGKSTTITGSARMKQRPIKILVDALRTIGAEINYLENEGYPPIVVNGKELTANEVSLSADVSSQYISALLLIAPKLKNGLKLTLTGRITSMPYIRMTLSLLKELGVESDFTDHVVSVSPMSQLGKQKTIVVESDWSAASYFYSIVALSPVGTTLKLQNFKKNSYQGDSALVNIYSLFGVYSKFNDEILSITKHDAEGCHIDLNLNNTPDIAQTITVTCFGLGISCHLRGLHTLAIKETDRLQALKTELQKLGARIDIAPDSLYLYSGSAIHSDIVINTYEDHRMAMAFAALGTKVAINIADAEVVSKSYPTFWNDIDRIGLCDIHSSH